MFSSILYGVIGLLVALSMLLFLALQILRAKGQALTKGKMQRDIETLDFLSQPGPQTTAESPPPIVTEKTFTPSI
jgi:hypothetical protein